MRIRKMSNIIKVTFSSLIIMSTLATAVDARPTRSWTIMSCKKLAIGYKCAKWINGRCMKKVPIIICKDKSKARAVMVRR